MLKKLHSSASILVSALVFSCVVPQSVYGAYDSIKLGDFSVGGALRANFVHDSKDDNTRNIESGDQGVFDLDMARIDINYKNDSLIGAFQYRWYPGYLTGQNGTNYGFIHTAWIGYQLDTSSQIQVGINRVPFGPGAWGISQSWFFDQHYYVGLTDDMDLGVKYSSSFDNIKYDFAYYPKSEPKGTGTGGESARYAYDVLGEFEEKNQLNARMIYVAKIGENEHDFGFSVLYSELESQVAGVDDGSRYAVSAHMKNRWQSYNRKSAYSI